MSENRQGYGNKRGFISTSGFIQGLIAFPDEESPLGLDELCLACGLTRGAHAAASRDNPFEWCPAHEGYMDFMRTTQWTPTGERARRDIEVPVGQAAARQVEVELVRRTELAG